MREETRKRLERVLFVRRLKWGAAAVAVAVLIVGGFYWKGLDISVVQTRTVEGTVVSVEPPPGKLGSAVTQTNFQIDIKLDDARVAHLLIERDKAPKLGEHVKVADHVHGSGRHTFGWK